MHRHEDHRPETEECHSCIWHTDRGLQERPYRDEKCYPLVRESPGNHTDCHARVGSAHSRAARVRTHRVRTHRHGRQLVLQLLQFRSPPVHVATQAPSLVSTSQKPSPSGADNSADGLGTMDGRAQGSRQFGNGCQLLLGEHEGTHGARTRQVLPHRVERRDRKDGLRGGDVYHKQTQRRGVHAEFEDDRDGRENGGRPTSYGTGKRARVAW